MSSSGHPGPFDKLRQQLARASNEEEVRLAWVRALETALEVTFDAERGRRDLSYNQVIIEFKAPGKFGGRTTSAAFREAMQDRLLPYIRRTAREEGLHEQEYIGIASDGNHLALAQVVNGTIVHQNLLPLSPRTFGMVVQACRNRRRRAVTATNLIEDFGHASASGTALLRALAAAMADAGRLRLGNRIRMVFAEWRALYGQVADLSPHQLEAVNGALRFAPADTNADVPARLFVVHTFNSLLTKLLCAEILTAHGLGSGRTFASDLLATRDDSELLRRLSRDVEEAGFFEAIGIRGFVEEPFFRWYLDIEDEEPHRAAIAGAIRDVLAALALYRMEDLDRSRDVLRDLYQDLVPEILRKNLGEFYTPDWLVRFTVDRSGTRDWIGARVLDPTCGSGSFLVEVIRRKRLAAASQGLSAARTVEMIAESVWGFDLNPLAVQVARANFLMAVADLLRDEPGQQLTLPVLLADAVYFPARVPSLLEDAIEYRIGSPASNLVIRLPAAVASDSRTLDRVLETLGRFVENDEDYARCEEALAASRVLTEEQLQRWGPTLKRTYEQVLELHRRGWNGVWFRIVRSFFRSAGAGRFDVIVGNPPWVRWSKLPESYRERAKPTCEQYAIFSETPHHGGNELDISGMITYTTADKWLKPGGTLAFVITQTHFQSPSSQGFRRFRIGPDEFLAPSSVDDMATLKPFPDAANKTSVAVFRKGAAAPRYPVSYRRWAPSRSSRAIPANLSLPQVMERLEVHECEAHPVDGEGSPWAILPPGRFAAVARLRGRSPGVRGRKGITTDLNAVYFVNVDAVNGKNGLVRVTTRPQTGKTDIGGARSFWIEPTLLYPLLKGAADFETCYTKPRHRLFAFVPNHGIRQQDHREAEEHMARSCPRTEDYFRAYERWLRKRSTWRGRMPGAPFYAVYNVGRYTFAPYKVLWAEQSRTFKAAVATGAETPLVGHRPYVPDHKIFFVEFADAAPAYFLCGLLSSSLVREFVESHTIAIQVGNIFKHMRLPSFDPSVEDHELLSDLVERAHGEPNEAARRAHVQDARAVADRLLGSWTAAPTGVSAKHG